MFGFQLLDWIALGWFATAWLGYHMISRWQHMRHNRLQTALQWYVQRWAHNAAYRDVKLVDSSVLANLERNGAFLASSSLVILAGILAVAASSEKVVSLLGALTLLEPKSHAALDFILMLLGLSYVYAFFTFTWCIRQYAMASILVGSLPLDPAQEEERSEARIEALSLVVRLATFSFAQGLRAYYFSLPLLAWLIHPAAMMVATAWVVAVLYRRDFHSRTFRALQEGMEKTVQ